MQVFRHHVYEYKKGLRNLVLYTGKAEYKQEIVRKLKKNKIAYLIRRLSNDRINVFFGDRNCIRILKTFGNKSLSKFTDEEDFILGTMLGYSRKVQCERFLERKGVLRKKKGA